jgi:tyrosyl-tRNA synthetase
MNFKSQFLQEYFYRGFFNQCTDIEKLDNLLTTNKIKAYIGFDCTANSLHVGSLLQIMILRLLQKHGHQPIILLGGATTKIGDPSGKDETRQVLTNEKINENLFGIKKTLEKFINFNGNNPAIIVNNDDWLKELNYISFLRDIGRHFSINRMLTFDSVKNRIEREQNLSFLEFNYMILQAYDFVILNQNYQCILQIGGSDQWGNIVNGVELSRRLNAHDQNKNPKKNFDHELFGLTSPLLTTADGKKMGKTADGAVWLDSNLLDPFQYFQYFRNVDDQDVIKFLKLFTDLELSEIEKYQQLTGQELNQAKEILAFETTKICHGLEIAKKVLSQAQEIFNNKNSQSFIEKIIICNQNSKKIIDVIFELGIYSSKSEIKRLIEGKAIKINNQIVNDLNQLLEQNHQYEISIGKKNFFLVKLK